MAGTIGTAAPPAEPPVVSTIPQFLTSDGGTEAFSGANFSGPTRDRWHNRLGFAWKRLYDSGPLQGRGNWLDFHGEQEGTAPYASTGSFTMVDQSRAVLVTNLVGKWLTTGENRGFYLNSRASAWLIDMHGRGAATPAHRPTLVVATSAGTFTLVAAANASWAKSSYTGGPSKNVFRLAADAVPAIVRFDLGTVSGTLVSAVLTLTCASFDTGHTGQIIDVYEADPPTIIDPITVADPELGLLAEHPNFNAFKATVTPVTGPLLFADDFEMPGSFDGGFSPPAVRTLNDATGTVSAMGTIAGGGAPGSGTGSADIKKQVTTGVNPRGTPANVYEELHGHYRWRMRSNFGTKQDDAIKIPAMGVQFGVWNPVGYWQQTTGNGGYAGTGLKVDNGGSSNFEYQGHSVRFLTGNAPRDNDDDPYRGWFGVFIYPYNLDQGGPFPPAEAFPWVAIRLGAFYDFDIRIKQNTLSGSPIDALGNYADGDANADGIYEVRINGHLSYQRTNFRWRRNAQFGVEFMWIDVYHGGQTPALVDMNYDVDQVANATAYIGPLVQAAELPAWVPEPGGLNVLTSNNGGLTNKFADIVASNFQPFYSAKIVNDYSGSVLNPYIGECGEIVFEGNGHSGSNDNMVAGLTLGKTSCTFRRITQPTALAPGNDITSNSALTDTEWGEYLLDGQPGSRHSWGDQNIQGPEIGGAAFGTFRRLVGAAVNFVGSNHGETPHKIDFIAPTGLMTYARGGTRRNGAGGSATAPMWSVLVPAQKRIYVEYHGGMPVSWFDLETNTYHDGTGTARRPDGIHADGGMMVYIPERSIVLFFDGWEGKLRVNLMDVSVSQPSWTNVSRTLSLDIPIGGAWSCVDYCSHSNKLIAGHINGDPQCVYEIDVPSNLNGTWVCERVALPGAITWAPSTCYKKWTYNRATRSFNFVPYVANALGSGSPDRMFVYRPRNT